MLTSALYDVLKLTFQVHVQGNDYRNKTKKNFVHIEFSQLVTGIYSHD